jgi:protein phosphatase 1A
MLFRCRIQFKGDLLISSPDVSLVELGPDVEFILLATDGLWDYMKRSFQASFIYNLEFSHYKVFLIHQQNKF